MELKRSLSFWDVFAIALGVEVTRRRHRVFFVRAADLVRQLLEAGRLDESTHPFSTGIGPGDTVAVMAPNIPALFEAHFGVPATGAVLNALNTRLDADSIAFILDHGEAKALITDSEAAPVVAKALAKLERSLLLIDIVVERVDA